MLIASPGGGEGVRETSETLSSSLSSELSPWFDLDRWRKGEGKRAVRRVFSDAKEYGRVPLQAWTRLVRLGVSASSQWRSSGRRSLRTWLKQEERVARDSGACVLYFDDDELGRLLHR